MLHSRQVEVELFEGESANRFEGEREPRKLPLIIIPHTDRYIVDQADCSILEALRSSPRPPQPNSFPEREPRECYRTLLERSSALPRLTRTAPVARRPPRRSCMCRRNVEQARCSKMAILP